MQSPAELFELALAVESSDIDQLGHVNNVTYLRWVQDVAVAHWKSRASAADQASLLWVVVRHEIDYKQAAYLNDGIIARTWVGAASRLRFERHTELLRARARTFWCPLDAQTGKPVSVSDEIRAAFSVEPPSAGSVL